jgi:hypothetical protein
MPFTPGVTCNFSKFTYSFFLHITFLFLPSFLLSYWIFNDAVSSSGYKALNDSTISDKELTKIKCKQADLF